MRNGSLKQPYWIARARKRTISAASHIELEWRAGTCHLREGSGAQEVFGTGIGWIVVTEGSFLRHNEGIQVVGPAVVSPRGLPLGTMPGLAWSNLSEGLRLTAGPTGCLLEFWSATADDIAEAKNGGSIASDFDLIMPLFRAAGFDPYLYHIQERTGHPALFSDVPHPDIGDRSLSQIDLRSVEAHSGVDGWKTLIHFGAPPEGLMLVLDGWVRYWVDVGDGEPHVHPRLIDVVRSPVLIGDAERPTRTAGRSAPTNGVSRVDVKAIDKKRSRVHYLVIPYDTLSAWYDASDIDVRLSAHSHDRLLRQQRWLSVGLNKPWRVLRWLLDEYDQRRSTGASPDIWIPTMILAHKQLAGAHQRATDDESLNQSAKDVRNANRKIITQLANDGYIVKPEEAVDGVEVDEHDKAHYFHFRVVPECEHELRVELCRAACTTFPKEWLERLRKP